jgi:hypothetical protein
MNIYIFKKFVEYFFKKGEDSLNNELGNYLVYVDDNFHYMDESYRYFAGAFGNFEEAVNFCKKILDDFLIKEYKNGMSADELYNHYTDFGEDPFIRSNDPDFTGRFSAWNYAKEKSAEICK